MGFDKGAWAHTTLQHIWVHCSLNQESRIPQFGRFFFKDPNKLYAYYLAFLLGILYSLQLI